MPKEIVGAAPENCSIRVWVENSAPLLFQTAYAVPQDGTKPVCGLGFLTEERFVDCEPGGRVPDSCPVYKQDSSPELQTVSQ